jgi:hypothetical protein
LLMQHKPMKKARQLHPWNQLVQVGKLPEMRKKLVQVRELLLLLRPAVERAHSKMVQ